MYLHYSTFNLSVHLSIVYIYINYVYISLAKVSAKEIKLLFDPSFMLTWCDWLPK